MKRAQLLALICDFKMLTKKECESVNEYLVANKMKNHGEQMQENVVVEKILRSMTTKFNYVVCSIIESNNMERFPIDELRSSLLVQEQPMNGQKDEQAPKVTGAVRGLSRGAGRGRGGKSSMEHLECYKCDKLGTSYMSALVLREM